MNDKVETILTNYLRLIDPSSERVSKNQQSTADMISKEIKQFKEKVKKNAPELLEEPFEDLRSKERRLQEAVEGVEGTNKEELSQVLETTKNEIENKIAEYAQIDIQAEVILEMQELVTLYNRLRHSKGMLSKLQNNDIELKDTQAAYNELLQQYHMAESQLKEQKQLAQPKQDAIDKMLKQLINLLNISDLKDTIMGYDIQDGIERFGLLVDEFYTLNDNLKASTTELRAKKKELKERLQYYKEEDAYFSKLGVANYQEWRAEMAKRGQPIPQGQDADDLIGGLILNVHIATQKQKAKDQENE